MTTESNAEQLERLKNVIKIFSEPRISAEDTLFLLGQADRAQELEKDNIRLKDVLIDAQEVVKKSVELLDNQEAENARLREALEKIAESCLDCFENECTYIARQALVGDPNGQH